jgi:hypothetical protein
MGHDDAGQVALGRLGAVEIGGKLLAVRRDTDIFWRGHGAEATPCELLFFEHRAMIFGGLAIARRVYLSRTGVRLMWAVFDG